MLVDAEILQGISKGEIVIRPFDKKSLGSNSYDVHLSPHLACYTSHLLDAAVENELKYFDIPSGGYILHPGKLYLGSTLEYTETHTSVPLLEGKSSAARLGITIHLTAGVGDVGFCGHWTLEIQVAVPVQIYAGMPIGQIMYQPVNSGAIMKKYGDNPQSKYKNQGSRPVGSKMYLNFKQL